MSGSLFSGQIPVSEISDNINQSVIQVTEDKLHLALIAHLHRVESKKNWIAPFGVFFSIAVTFLTTDFKDALGLPKETWSAIFVMSGGLSAFFVLRSLKAAFKSVSIEELIQCIKQGENRPS